MLASRTQRWWAIGAGLSVAILVVAWFLMISPRRADAAELAGQTEQLQSQTDQQQLRTAQLKADLAEVPKKKAELAAIKQQLPADADIPKTITDMEAFANQSGVSINQISPGSPTVAGDATGTAAAAATASVDAPVLVQVPISVEAAGDFFETSLFLKSLQSSMSRAMLVQSVQVSESTGTTAAPATTDSTSTGTTGTAVPGASATPTPAPAATTTTTTTTRTQMTITGQLFVLLDGSQSLADVKKDAKDAAKTTS